MSQVTEGCTTADSRAVGTVPKKMVKIGGATVEGLVDSGSQVTTVTESWFKEHLGSSVVKECHQFRLTAANGGLIPTVGCFVADVAVDGEVVEDVVVIILQDSTSTPCILGTNLLARLVNLNVPALLRAPRLSTVIPAQTVMNITATGGEPETCGRRLAEPKSNFKSGLSLIPTFGQVSQGRFKVPIANNTDEDIILPGRTVIGLLSVAAEDVRITDTSCETPCESRPAGVDDLKVKRIFL